MSSPNTRIIRTTELKRPEGNQDPRIERADDHLDDLEERLQHSGFISPFIITLDDYFLVDGNSRVQVLERLADRTGEDDYRKLELIGEKDGFGYAVPVNEVDLDPEAASMELNLFRQNTSQADRARFLDYLVQSRIVIECNGVARDATTELLDHLDHHTARGDNWDEPTTVKDELTDLLNALGFESPSNARKYVDYYHRAPELVRRLWALERISFSHVQQLTKIASLLDQDASLTAVESLHSGIGFEDLVDNSREAHRYDDQRTYYTRDELREIASDLETQEDKKPPESGDPPELTDTPTPPTTPGDDDPPTKDDGTESTPTSVREKLSSVQLNRVEEVAEFYDTSTDEILSTLAETDHPETRLNEMLRMVDQSKERADLEEYPELDEELHKARPIETEHTTCYFHDCKEMGAEISEDAIDLFLFSPPYFTQGHTIDPARWLETDEPVDSRAGLDRAYEGYLDEMYGVFEVLATHLAEGGHLVFVVSDVQAKYDNYSRRPRYDVPSDLSHLIRHRLNPALQEAGESTFQYQNTIVWNKDWGTGVEDFKETGNISQYRPNDTTERILVFRKGKTQNDATTSVDPSEFEDYWDSLWTVRPETQSAHPATYPKELVMPLIELYSAPGDTVADPMCGSGTTQDAVREVNKKYTTPRTAYGWEAFVSEDYDQADYWSMIYYKVKIPELREDGPVGLDAWAGLA